MSKTLRTYNELLRIQFSGCSMVSVTVICQRWSTANGQPFPVQLLDQDGQRTNVHSATHGFAWLGGGSTTWNRTSFGRRSLPVCHAYLLFFAALCSKSSSINTLLYPSYWHRPDIAVLTGKPQGPNIECPSPFSHTTSVPMVVWIMLFRLHLLPSIRSRPPLIQLESLGEHCKLPHRGLVQSLSR